MSGPVRAEDVTDRADGAHPAPPVLELVESSEAQVGRLTVRRALPRRARRTVGPWCFVDHMGPASISPERGADVAPHPHIGLQTVTWLISGEILHRDSLGTEQVIRPGQLNVMTAGNGVSHSEEGTGAYTGELQGFQLWAAQPEATRHGDNAFEHHADLPVVDLGEGQATVLVGSVGGDASPARHDTGQLGLDLDLRAGVSTVALDPAHEHALVLAEGAASVDDQLITPGNLAYLGKGRDHIDLRAEGPVRAVLVGGEPFESPIMMWWNFVARTREELEQAHRDWMAADERYGTVASLLPRTEVDGPFWTRS